MLPPLTVHPDDPPPSHISAEWQIQLDTLPVLAFFPTENAVPAYAHDGRIVIAGSDRGELVAATADTGHALWRFRTQGKIRGGLTVEGTSAYVGATDGKLYRIDARSGELSWSQPFDTRGAITAAPAVADNRVFFRNNENRVYALDARTGGYLWDQGRRRADELTITGEASPVVAGDHVLVGFDDGTLSSFRVATGDTEWSKSLAGTESRFVDVDATPVVYEGVAYAAGFATGLYALDVAYGGIKWRYPDAAGTERERRGIQSPAVDDRYLYVSNIDGNLVALEPASGKVAWSLTIPSATFSAPTVAGSYVFVATGKGFVMVDAATGRVRARVKSDDGQSAAVVSSHGYVHFVTNSGALVGARIL